MLCEKAFSYCFATSPEEIAKTSSSNISQTSYLVDVAGNRTTQGTHADLIRVTSNKLVLNPSLKSTFEDLHSGDYRIVADMWIDGKPVIDTFLVAKAININCFACPLTSKHMIEDAVAYRKNKLSTTGLWIKASYINHSCDDTCARSFIGDMLIVRAARDMPTGSELTFSYINRDEPTAMNKILKEGWGFECDCSRCVDDRATSATIKAERSKLIKSFNAAGVSSNRKLDIVSQLNKTYQQPPTKVPRFDMWDLHYRLVEESAKKGDPENVIEHVLAAFESLGYVIEGARITPSPSTRLIVRKWGAPHDETTSAFLSLRNIYKLFDLAELA
ncbi:hypothetical protein ONS95_014483 [Cadophora gregata]|uniref:uncharacterized protein n=1 Tax=Cadophora gregata TaxID=51156 RepID=UPI0026DD3995|nr:uncharacterized protein ONS95_014483 [Cadophora gregata]KAK0112748.1 hypothetical protein ONS95_014483 [Cadophora gregata]